MYRTILTLSVCTAVCLAFASPAKANFEAGDFELTLSGSGGNDRNFDSGFGNVNASLGYFLNDDLAVSLDQQANYVTSGNWGLATSVGLDYHFDLDRLRPYIGANIGYVYGDNFRDTWAAGPQAGVKYFVSDRAFIFAEAQYQFFFRNANDIDNQFDNGRFVYGLGLGVRF